MTHGDDEKRSEPRRNLNLQIEYPDRQGYPIDVTEAVAANGIFIRSAQHHRLGEEINLAISLPGFPDTLRVRGVVTRIREATAKVPRGVALEFAEEEYQERLAELMTPAESRDFNLATGPYATLAALPRVRLATTPTPLHRADRLSKLLGGPDIWFKREDLTGFALGGSHVRKLEFVAADALQAGADTLVGAASTPNAAHLRIMSAVAARLGMRSVAIVPPQGKGSAQRASYCDQLGTIVHEVDLSTAPVEALLANQSEALENDGYKPYVLGDQHAWLAACGYVLASIELLVQMRRRRIDPAALVCSVGGAEMMSGLLLAQLWLDGSYEVQGVSIERDEYWCTERVATVASEVGLRLKIAHSIPVADIAVYDEFAHDKRDGKAQERIHEAVRTVARTEGIFLDPVDSGVAMAGLIDRIKRGDFAKGQAVVFVHSGSPT